MNFDEFQAAFIKENRKLKIIISIMILVFGVGTVLNITERKYFLYRGKEIFEERPLAEEICRLGFMTLADGEPNQHVVTSEIMKHVKQEPFTLQVDKLLMVKSVEGGACKVILKSEGKILAFKIHLEGSSNHPFFYKVSQMDEVPIEKDLL